MNILFISMDTTRADHLGCYGHPFIRTPNIDRLSREGATFLNCTSSAPITLPSHSAMMTANHPFVHGARDNGDFHLHEDNVTLAEVLKREGYATAAEVAAFVLNREYGLNQGFDSYGDIYSLVQRTDEEERFVTERIAEDVGDQALVWLRERAAQPFFLFVHFFDPHQPYRPPEEYLNQYAEPYLGEIAYTDAHIGRLLAALEELDIERRTLVVLTADHGDGLGQHDEETHATFLYDSTLSVPLIFRCPGVIPSGRRLEAQVRLVDIAPTILDLVKAPPLHHVQGVSLAPLISGARTEMGLSAYSESLYAMHHFGMSPLRALRSGGWKYIHAPRPELYQISVDPGELRNLATEAPERVARMRGQLRKLLEDAPTVIGAEDARADLTPESIKALQALGYVAGGSIPSNIPAGGSELDLFEPRGLDPKDHAGLVTLAARTIGLVRAGDPEAEESLRKCIAQAPDPDVGFAWAYMDLAGILEEKHQYQEAIEWYERALRASPNDGRTITALGNVLRKAGRIDDGIAMLEAALKVQPVFAQTHCSLGAALLTKGEVDKAIESLRKALEMDPKLTFAHRILGRAFARRGQWTAAIAAYQVAVDLAPDKATWRRELAGLLLYQGTPEAALDHYLQSIRTAPDDAAAHAGLGEVYKLLGQPIEAEQSFQRALKHDPNYVPAHDALGLLLQETARHGQAIQILRRGLELGPNHPNMANNLAWLLAASPDRALRNGAEAVRWARQACQFTHDRNIEFLDTLAAAYAEAGRFEDAVATARRALDLANGRDDPELADRIEKRLKLYSSRQPYHEP